MVKDYWRTDAVKIAVITRYAVINYGSLLQAMATQYAIEKIGHTCEIINYIRKDETYKQHERTLLKRKEKWNKNALMRTIYLMVRQPACIAAGKRFKSMLHKYLHLSPLYDQESQLIDNPPQVDVYMTGSDQGWGPVADGTYDSTYFLSFAKGRKVSYATSFDHTKITNDLQSLMNEPYDHKRWHQLCEDTRLFKLTWKQEFYPRSGKEDTFYGRMILNEHLDGGMIK